MRLARVSLVFIFLMLAIIAYYLQTQLFLSGDISYLMYAANELLHGGSYSTHFFETNPPLILYLYLPPVIIGNITHISTVILVRIYTLLIAGLSLFLCHIYLKKYLLNNYVVHYYLLFTLSIIFLFLPACQFGQREHLMEMFTLPYWLLLATRLRDNKAIQRSEAIGIGLFASLGFALKPFFLIPLVLVEMYFILEKRNIFAVLRPETVTLLFIFVLYLLSIYHFQPDYFSIILPWVGRYYFYTTAEAWSVVLSGNDVFYCFVVAFAYPFLYRYYYYKTLATILELVLIGFILAFLCTKTSWYYHVLPAMSMACLLLALAAAEIISIFKKTWIALLLTLIAFGTPVAEAWTVFKIKFEEKKNLEIKALIHYLQTYFVNKKIYCFPTHELCSTLATYENIHYVNLFPSLWPMRALLILPPTPQIKKDSVQFIQMITNDIIKNQPDVILIDTHVIVGDFDSGKQYIAYFSQNNLFKKNWLQYHYVKTIARYEIYTKK